MADEGTCYRCGDAPPGPGVLYPSCFDCLGNRPPSEIYAAILGPAA